MTARRSILLCGAMQALALLAAAPAAAQEAFPIKDRPIAIVVPFAAGSGTDAIARAVAEKMAVTLKTPIIVENKPGASGQLASEYVARAAPDGHTLLMGGNSTHSANPYLFKRLKYDPIKDFTPIGLATIAPLALLVPAASPAKTAAELVQLARTKPGGLSYGYSNTGGQISSAMFVNSGRLTATPVPYKDAPRMLTDLASNQIDFAIIDFAAARPMMTANRVRALATTSRNRISVAKDTPAMRETPVPGYENYEMASWVGLFGPANVAPATAAQLNAALSSALAEPDVRDRLINQMMQEIMPQQLSEFSTFLREQDEIYRRRIKEAGMVAE
ncbi:MAG: Bug family tripartite tricarboxylate transporter substrate binding protein [Burkholderiaceae bacterium]